MSLTFEGPAPETVRHQPIDLAALRRPFEPYEPSQPEVAPDVKEQAIAYAAGYLAGKNLVEFESVLSPDSALEIYYSGIYDSGISDDRLQELIVRDSVEHDLG